MKVPAPTPVRTPKEKGEWFLPGVIVAAGALIAIAIFMVRYHAAVVQSGNPSAVAPVNPTTDHYLGNPNAPIKIVEYGDIDSEFSKDFQPVMEQVMQQYGTSGQVMWVYREFPLSNEDPNAGEHAEAAECVAALSNNANFFKFIDAIEAAAPGESQFNPSGYDAIVSSLGIAPGDFDTCLTSHTYQKNVAADFKNGEAIGATGAPDTVVIVKGQKPFVIAGEVPFATMQGVIDNSLSKLLQN